MRKVKKIVIVEDSCAPSGSKITNIESPVEVVQRKTSPSFWWILIAKNTSFKLKKDEGFLYKSKRLFVKLLNKKFNKLQLLEILFRSMVNSKNILVITHDTNFLEIFLGNLPDRYLNNVAYIALYSLYQKTERQRRRFKAYFTKLEKLLVSGSRQYPICTEFTGNILISNQTNLDFIKILSIKFPKAKIIVKYEDYVDFLAKAYGTRNDGREDHSVAGSKNEIKYKDKFRIAVNAMKNYGVRVISYSRHDAKLFGLEYEPSGVSFDIFQKNERKNRLEPYCFFAGVANGTRSKKLYALAKKLIKNRVHVNFLLVQLNEDYYNKFKQLAQSEYFNLSVTRKEYKEIIAEQVKSDFVIDFCRVSQSEGYSYRIPEALATSKKIITDRLSIKEEPFYSPENILCSEDLDFTDEELSAFLKRRTVTYPKDAIAIFNVENQCYWPEEWKNQGGS